MRKLRALARWARDRMRVAPPASVGIRKRIDGMNRMDNAVASAFYDYLLAERFDKLLALFKTGDLSKQSLDVMFGSVFGEETPDKLDQAFLRWFPNNY